MQAFSWRAWFSFFLLFIISSLLSTPLKLQTTDTTKASNQFANWFWFGWLTRIKIKPLINHEQVVSLLEHRARNWKTLRTSTKSWNKLYKLLSNDSISQLTGIPGRITEISSHLIKNRLTTNIPHNEATRGDWTVIVQYVLVWSKKGEGNALKRTRPTHLVARKA